MRKKLLIWLGLAGAPTAWIMQMALSEIIASYACYPHAEPLPVPLWGHMTWAIGILDWVCFLAALACAAVTWGEWQNTRREVHGKKEHVIESGETRDGFIVMISAISSGIFTIAIVFTSGAILLVDPCRPW